MMDQAEKYLVFDQTLNKNHANQNDNTIKPTLCNVSNRVNNRYFIEFSGREVFKSEIDLKPPSRTSNINFFMIYRLKDYDGSRNWLRNCFFRQGYYFVGFSTLRDLITSNSSSRFIRIGVANDAVAPYKNKANAGELNKWCSLSVHWYHVSPRTDKSSVYCIGVKLTNFTSTNLQIKGKMEIGAFNFNNNHRFSNFELSLGGTGMFKGNIAFFMFKKRIMNERNILMYH